MTGSEAAAELSESDESPTQTTASQICKNNPGFPVRAFGAASLNPICFLRSDVPFPAGF
jgi:hypothetical protein